MKKSIQISQNEIDFMTDYTKQATVILKNLSAFNIEFGETQDFSNGLFHLGKDSPVQFVRITIDELQSTGKFHILRNA